MASCSIPAKESDPAKGSEEESVMVPNWLDLPRDITANILQRLGTFEIVTSACEVCPLWWKICKDPLMWRTICMTNFSDSSYPNNYMDLVIICGIAVERSCSHVEDIDIEYFGHDFLLETISENASNLRSLRLVNCWRISDKGFSEAVRKFSKLEKLDISHCFCPCKNSFEVIGRSCPLLKSLKFAKTMYKSEGYDDEVAFAIAETMSGLCHLDIEGYKFTNDGLLAILDGCPLLESLNIMKCLAINVSESLKKRCRERAYQIFASSDLD